MKLLYLETGRVSVVHSKITKFNQIKNSYIQSK